jgi:Ribosomal protein L10
MPKSKRDRLVVQTATSKKTRIQKQELIQTITTHLTSHTTAITFKVENYRNVYFKEIRSEFKQLGRYQQLMIDFFTDLIE